MATEYAELGDNNAVPVESGGTGVTTAQGVVDAFGIFLAISAAAAYDPEGSYAVGDYCTHGGNLHKCGTAIPDGEPWNAEHWTTTTVAAELAELSSQLSNALSNIGRVTQDIFNDPTYPHAYVCSADDINTGVSGLPAAGHWRILYIPYFASNEGWSVQVAVGAVTNSGLCWRKASGTVWGSWESAATATPPQVRNLTLQSGFTADEGGCTFFKLQENIVFLDGGVAGTLPAEKLTQIGTLPTGFYPISDKRRDAVTTTGTAYIEIHTDGTVWIYPFTASIRCWFSTSFEAALGGGT